MRIDNIFIVTLQVNSSRFDGLLFFRSFLASDRYTTPD